jgi:hypothetical protein
VRYLIVCEDGIILQADKITQRELDAFFSGMINIIDTQTMTVWCDDLSWKPIDEWKS